MSKRGVTIYLHNDVSEELELVSKILKLEYKTLLEFAVIHFLSSIRNNQLQLVLSPEYKEAIRNANSWELMKEFQTKLESMTAKKIAHDILMDDVAIRHALAPKNNNSK